MCLPDTLQNCVSAYSSASLPPLCLCYSIWGYLLLLWPQKSVTPGLGHCTNIP